MALKITKQSCNRPPLVEFVNPSDDRYLRLENVDNVQQLNIQVAGYSQVDNSGKSRQVVIEYLMAQENKGLRNARFRLELEPDNKFDCNAIKVILIGNRGMIYDLGYIPKTANQQLIDFYSNCNPRFRRNINKVIGKLWKFQQVSSFKKEYITVWITLPLRYDVKKFCYEPKGRLALVEFDDD